MSNKKLILCKFIFFIGMCVLYSCSWQGLELYFYGKITTEDFDTIRCVTMLPVFWKLTNYFATSFIQKIHIIPLPGQEREFSHKRLEVFATRCASYLGIWALLEVMFFKSYKHQIVELIMLFVFGGLVWIVSKYSLSAIMGSANTGKSNLVNRFNKLNLRDIYMIYKDHNEYSMYTYDPKDKDDKFIGFQIAYFRFEFLNLTKTQRNIIQEVLDRAYSDHSFELVEIIMALRSIHIAYYLTFAPTSDMSGEVAVYTYASSFLPFMVVIKSSGKNTSMGAEGTYDTASAKYYVPSISKGESYLVTDYGSQDSYKENYANWTIKLTTRNANDKSVTQDNKIQNIKKEITEKDLGLHSISDLELDAGNVVYNGKSKKPNTIVTTDNDELLDLNDDYYAVYKNNKNIGLATVTIKGKSFFVGSKTKKFWIHPDKVKSLKVKQKRNITTIRFRKNKGGVTGYRIKYSTRRDMKHCKYIMTKKNVCKIKNRHKLYVRVKAYKQVGTKKVYSVKWAK